MQEYMTAAIEQHNREAEQLRRAAEARRITSKAGQNVSFLRRILSFGMAGSHTASAH